MKMEDENMSPKEDQGRVAERGFAKYVYTLATVPCDPSLTSGKGHTVAPSPVDITCIYINPGARCPSLMYDSQMGHTMHTLTVTLILCTETHVHSCISV